MNGIGSLPIFKRLPPVSGIYFLLRNGRVVYVGQSTNVHARVSVHALENKKDFDSYAVMAVPPASLNDKEAEMILAHNPEYNSGIPVNTLFVSSVGIKSRSGKTRESVRRKITEAGIKPSHRVWFGVFFRRSDLLPIFPELKMFHPSTDSSKRRRQYQVMLARPPST